MKQIILCLLITLSMHCLNAQSIERQTFTNGGNTSNMTNGSISFSIGQHVAQTLKSGSLILTQGFQQSPTSSTVGVTDLFNNGTYTVFPNPSDGNFILEIDSENRYSGKIVITNLLGELVQEQDLEPSTNSLTAIELDTPLTGIYFLSMVTDDAKLLFSEKLFIQQ